MKRFLLILLTMVLVPVMAHAASVVDLNTGDGMRIDNQDYTGSWPNQTYVVKETIAESTIVPYPSHDGYAIVNEKGGYFEKEVTLTGVDLLFTNLNFQVTNKSGLAWSDYHFELSCIGDDTKNSSILSQIIESRVTSDVFDELSIEGSSLNFWSNDYEVASGQTVNFYFDLGFENIETLSDEASKCPDFTFKMTQVATTVPIPNALLLLGSGLVGLAGFRRRKQNR